MAAKKPPDEARQRTAALAQEIIDQLSAFCRERLNDEYAALGEKLVLKLSRKRAVPFVAGRPSIWAGAVLYALGQINFLFDRSQTPHVTQAEIASYFGTTTSTLGQKARFIRELLGLGYFSPEFSRAEVAAQNPLANLMNIGGIAIPLSLLSPQPGSKRRPER
jgi:hypothetical protein